jgi:competence protein ComEC
MRRWVLLGVVVLVVLSGCAGLSGEDPADDIEDTAADGDDPQQTEDAGPTAGDGGEGTLEIHHIDVGQADSTLLVTPGGETVLVDTGDWQADGEQVIDYLETLGIERIDHLVATHPHADHIGGHAAVIEHFEENRDGVGAIYDSGQPHDTLTYERYLDAVDAYGHELLVVEEGDELPLDSGAVEALVLNPLASDAGGLHDNSVALAVEFGDVRYLLTGDAERNVEARLVAERADQIDADVYQAGHHGSSTSSTDGFVDAVDPEVAVISSGYDSQFGHPHDEVLERLAGRGVETYWTAVHGDIVVTTDGTAIEVTPAESFSTDPADLLAEKPGDGRVGRAALAGGTALWPVRGGG